MKEIFDDYVKNSFGTYEQSVNKFKQFEFNYKKYFPIVREAKVLDIGIGRGEMLTMMREWGYVNYLGIDISSSTVNFCKSINLNAQLIDNVPEFLISNRESYHVITLLDVLEHIKKEEIIPLLESLRNSLASDGILIIQVPNLQSPDGFLHRYNDITHHIGFIEHSLGQVLLAAGFNNFKFEGFEELVFNSPINLIRKVLRKIFLKYVRLTRWVNGNLNPKILNPVFFAIVHK